MHLKTVEVDGKTYAEVQDGKPVFLDDGGKEVAFDAPHATATISRLNGEAKSHREAKEAAESALKKFGGIEDPAEALKALETVKNLDDKKLIDAGEVEKVKAAVVKTYEEKLAEVAKVADSANAALHKEMIGGSFARSRYIAENLVSPAPMVEATFGNHFTIEDGKLSAKDASGNPIYSDARPGELASFDEALEKIVNASVFKDSILKGRGQQGSGAKGGSGAGGKKTLTRQEFDGMDHAARRKAMSDGAEVVD